MRGWLLDNWHNHYNSHNPYNRLCGCVSCAFSAGRGQYDNQRD